MMLHQVAARNLLRNRRRSIATALTIAIGVTALLLFGGFRADLIKMMLTGYVRTMGHVVVQHQDFFEYGSGNPAQYSIPDATAVRNALLAQPDLASSIHVATPLLECPSVAGHAARETSKTVLIIGLNADDQSRMRTWDFYDVRLPITPLPLAGKPSNSALLGMGVARMLQVCSALPGGQKCGAQAPRPQVTNKPINNDLLDLAAEESVSSQGAQASKASSPSAAGSVEADRAIEVLAATTRGVPNVKTFQVIGAESQGFKEMDDAYVIVSYEAARDLLFGRGAKQATSIAIQLHNPSNMPTIVEKIRLMLAAKFPGTSLTVRTVNELTPFIDQTISMFNTIFGFIAVLIISVVMFTVANTVSASILERTTEIGTIRALGLRRSTVMQLFLLEATILALVGTLLGIAGSVSMELLINALQLTWFPPGGSEHMPLTVSVFREFRMVMGALVIAVVFSTLAALPAANKAARLKIVDALRFT